jgi:hypothetical protein
MPKIIQDAVLVTKELGYDYFWIDQYSIDQNDSQAKHDQIQQMDTIYRNAEITLVAAAGEDAGYGLPGVSNERNPQPVVNLGNISIFSTITHTRDAIKNSTWNKRGWTFQEAILSRRRLVFTDDEVYFECAGKNCFESSPHNLVIPHQDYQGDKIHGF